MYVPGDAAATTANVVANAGLVRLGVVSDLLDQTVFIFLALTLYVLLKHVHKSMAGAMVVLVSPRGRASRRSTWSSSSPACGSQPVP